MIYVGDLVTFAAHLFLGNVDPDDDCTGAVEEIQGDRVKVWVKPPLCADWDAGEIWLKVSELDSVTPPPCECGAPLQTETERDDGECAGCERIQRNHPRD